MPGNIERKARRKRQTRLTFDPIDKSSSPAPHMSPAKVRYQLPGVKGRSTPLSSMVSDNEEDEGDEILTSSRRTTKAVSGLFKTLPTPVKSSQITDDFDNPFHSPSKRQMNSKVSPAARRYQGEIDSSDGSEPEDDEVRTPSKRKRNTRSKGKAKVMSDSEEIASSARATRSSVRQKFVTISDGSDDELSLPVPRSARKSAFPDKRDKVTAAADEDSDLPMPSSTRRGSRKTIVIEDEDEESEELPVPSKKGKEKEMIELSDDSDESLPAPNPKRNIQIVVPQPDTDDEDEEPVTSPPKRRRVAQHNASDSDDSNLPSLDKLSSTRCTNSKSPTTPSRVTRQQNPRKHRTEKEKTMELLKRKRAGEKISELTESEFDSDEEDAGGIYDSGSDLKALSEFEDEEESPEPVRRPKPKKRTAAGDDHYDSEFVVEDDDEPLGVPTVGLMDIPLEFTHAAHKPLKEHFKDAVEWLIHNKVNPGFERRDPVYRQAFLKLSNEYETLAMSKFKSTQWTNDFTKALNARPVFVQRELEVGEGILSTGEYRCDACNHRKHVPKYAISFHGKPYNKETLEEVDQDSDSEDEDVAEENRISVDQDGYELPPMSKEWNTGKFCHENAYQAHILIHWRFALNDWVLDTLEQAGLLTPEKLAARDRMNRKQREKNANHIVDVWEANGLLKKLYRDFKSQLETARDAKMGSGAGGNYR